MLGTNVNRPKLNLVPRVLRPLGQRLSRQVWSLLATKPLTKEPEGSGYEIDLNWVRIVSVSGKHESEYDICRDRNRVITSINELCGASLFASCFSEIALNLSFFLVCGLLYLHVSASISNSLLRPVLFLLILHRAPVM